MIKYNLICKCGGSFESWFLSSSGFDALCKRKLIKCIYCGFCEEACPVDAIVETRIHEYHMEKAGENIMTKDKLLAIGDKFEAMISADKAADAQYK